ncbi:LD-carboxypeptidase [Williamsoniiplasma lucivorax]|uniref:LD-carboxypeptidase n=1 Tax=Williamsoniiplasma lucivorax TaxID=209274 RepID=A0A2S5RES8_9MOLU|nr:LD-carboxypeptidase [Williamsoniiplasma lucivorax]PPE05797.1 hypothetical protein ELUCI_v1c00850 [Williamsoniiplasma lucivorax]
MKIGIFTASTPIGSISPKRGERAINFLKAKGHEVILGELFYKNENYVAGNAKQRANEINNLVFNGAELLLSAIGGSNTSSILPFLDYELINKKGVIFCGFSDSTSLLSAILKKCPNCRVIYGPALFPNFGEFEEASREFSYNALMNLITKKPTQLPVPDFYYTSFQNWENFESQRSEIQNRWSTLNFDSKKELYQGTLFGGNGNTMMSIVGSDYVFKPNEKAILLIEDDEKTAAELERIYNSLILNKKFENVECIIFGKTNVKDFKNLTAIDILNNCLLASDIKLPILYDVDLSHIKPMSAIELGKKTTIEIKTKKIWANKSFGRIC